MVTNGQKAILGGLGLCVVAAALLALFVKKPGDETVSIPLPDGEIRGEAVDDVPLTEDLELRFQQAGFDWEAVVSGKSDVPALFIDDLPADLGDLVEVDRRKAVFFRIMLPLVLRANADIAADRARIEALADDLSGLEDDDMDWLADLMVRYRVDLDDQAKANLLRRVDIIPPSLALAQAAEESGWGTSRFAQEGNALFGQWTTTGPGLVPEDREEGKTHKVRAFETLYQSVRAYGDNLNRHKAYRNLRKARFDLRARGAAVTGLELAKTLTRYSERGKAYVKSLSSLIRSNDLDKIDGVQFRRGRAGS
ncbi:MAG: glucosaminidase domain-containing protein [Magnetovibrionaceae bacterium]